MQWDTMTREQYEALQDRQLKRFIAEEVYPFHPYYGDLFRKHGILPRHIGSVSDLRHFSELFTTKTIIAAQPEAFVVQPTPKRVFLSPPRTRPLVLVARELARAGIAIPNLLFDQTLNRLPSLLYRFGRVQLPRPLSAKAFLEYRYAPHFPTGTTGRSTGGVPTVFWFTGVDMARMAKLGSRYFSLLGMGNLQPQERRCIDLFPVSIHLADLFLREVSRGVPAMVFPTGGGKGIGTERSLRVAEASEARLLAGVPDYVERFLEYAVDEKRNLSHVERVILGGDAVGPKRRESIIELLRKCGAMDPVVIASYGFTEAKIAFIECVEGAREGGVGYHVFPELGAVEILDPDPNSRGEVCWSTIVGAGTVVLRYRTGDHAAFSWEPCPACGRTLPRIVGPITRKTSDMIKNIAGTLVDFNHVCEVFENDASVTEWQVEIAGNKNTGERLNVFVALRDGTDNDAACSRLVVAFQTAADGLAPYKIRVLTHEELVARLGIETELKAQRIKDLRKEA